MDKRHGMVLVDIAVWSGRFFGLLIVAISLAVAGKVAADSSGEEMWIFLANVMTPMGIGFLIIVTSEVVNRLSKTPD